MNVTPSSLALYAFTLRGLELGLRLAGELGGVLHAPLALRQRAPAAWGSSGAAQGNRSRPGGSAALPADNKGLSSDAGSEDATNGIVWFTDLRALLDGQFSAFQGHIFISATGIAVRAIAPHLRHKTVDPGVVVLDQQGQYAISLLSGHLGGANALTLRVADISGAVPVITTATEGLGLPAVDVLARERRLIIANPEAVKHISAALLEGRTVDIFDPHDCLGLAGAGLEKLLRPLTAVAEGHEEAKAAGELPEGTETLLQRISPSCPLFLTLLSPPPFSARCGSGPAILVTARRLHGVVEANCLVLHPPVLHLGVGCKRGTSAAELSEALERLLESHGLSPASLAGLASFSAKGDEPGLLALAAKLQLPLTLFPAAKLAAYPVSSPSAKAFSEFGLRGVCEPAALACAALQGGAYALAAPKTVFKGVTLALAVALPQRSPSPS